MNELRKKQMSQQKQQQREVIASESDSSSESETEDLKAECKSPAKPTDQEMAIDTLTS